MTLNPIRGFLGLIIFLSLQSIHAQVSVSILDYGAVPDGVTDNLPAINRAISEAAASGAAVLVPAGTFAYRGVIRLNGVKLVGAGPMVSVLYALDPLNESIFLFGSGPEVRNLQLTGVKASSRQAAWEATHITVFGARQFIIDNNYLEGAAAAGIQTAQRAQDGRISNNVIRNTLSDSIHITDAAGFISVENNRIENSGDDGIAVVSYASDQALVHDITARNNVILNNRWGRQMSVVGGQNILYENNYLEGNPNVACLYLAQEFTADVPSHTFGVHSVTARYNTIKNCGSTMTGHGAVLIYTENFDFIDFITLYRNEIIQSSNLTGIRIFGDLVKSVVFDNNKISGTSVPYAIESAGVQLIPYESGLAGFNPVPSPTSSQDLEAPIVKILSPTEGARLARGTRFIVKAIITDNKNIVETKFLLDGVQICIGAGVLDQCLMQVPKNRGSHRIEVQAQDAAGNIGRQAIRFYSK